MDWFICVTPIHGSPSLLPLPDPLLDRSSAVAQMPTHADRGRSGSLVPPGVERRHWDLHVGRQLYGRQQVVIVVIVVIVRCLAAHASSIGVLRAKIKQICQYPSDDGQSHRVLVP